MPGRNFCVSFAKPDLIKICHEIGQSVMIDNGAYSFWKQGKETNWEKYYKWTEPWLRYKTTWAIIPDVIGGTEEENDELINEWPFSDKGAPVWHMHESLDRLLKLASNWPRVCFGSTDLFYPDTESWHHRIREAFLRICDIQGVPITWVHMLRGMQFGGSQYPFSSCDSSYIGRNLLGRHLKNKSFEQVKEMVEAFDIKQCPPVYVDTYPRRLLYE